MGMWQFQALILLFARTARHSSGSPPPLPVWSPWREPTGSPLSLGGGTDCSSSTE